MTSVLTSTARVCRLAGVGLLLLGPACTRNAIELTSDGASTSGASTSTSTAHATTTALDSGATTIADDSTGTSTTANTTVPPGPGFVPEPDVGEGFQCDLFAQDCPAGTKCLPDGFASGSWRDAAWCSPIADEPVGVDEPCHAENTSGAMTDDCDVGLMCWNVDPKTGDGICASFCVGSPERPYCDDPGRYCQLAAASALALCLPTCDPLVQDCPRGLGCYPINDHWQCGPDGVSSQYGWSCNFPTDCVPGLACVDYDPLFFGSCMPAAGCCTEICDLSDPLGDAQCPDVATGQRCEPWSESPAPGYAQVGVCVFP